MGDVIRAGDVEPETFSPGIAAAWLVTAESAGAERIAFGRATYAPGTGIEPHRHPNAEEVVVVLSGSAEHVIEGRSTVMAPGDVCFIPRLAPHSMANASPSEDLVILWAYGGAASLAEAGFEPVGPQNI